MMKKYNQSFLPVLLLLLTALSGLGSCKKFLEEKPNQKLAVPATLTDIQLMLDSYFTFNNQYPSSGEVASDDYYMTDAVWAAISNEHTRDTYRWQANDTYIVDWSPGYKRIYTANVILEFLEKYELKTTELDQFNQLKGSALFFRGYNLFTMAQIFTAPYSAVSAANVPGLPLRLNSDYTEVTKRATLAQTFEQIIDDLETAATLLPEQPSVKSRPSKAAALGALARVYLVMQHYEKAELYAEATLELMDALLDYNTLNSAAAFPLVQYNSEVILDAMMVGITALVQSRWRADTVLYQSYADDDLRKKIFYRANADGSHTFKGSYTGMAVPFAGISTSEIWLILAEARARQGDINGAMDVLNHLLEHRWKTGTFSPLETTDHQQAIEWILGERRKELVYRNIRWMDLRRLSLEPGNAVIPKRWLQGQWYILEPANPRYTHLIPQSVIEFNNISQNP